MTNKTTTNIFYLGIKNIWHFKLIGNFTGQTIPIENKNTRYEV